MNRLSMYWIGILAGGVSGCALLICLETDAGLLGWQINYWLKSGSYFVAYVWMTWTYLKKRTT